MQTSSSSATHGKGFSTAVSSSVSSHPSAKTVNATQSQQDEDILIPIHTVPGSKPESPTPDQIGLPPDNPAALPTVKAEEAREKHEEAREEEDGLAAMRNRAAAIQQAMRDHDDLCLSTALGESLWLVQIAFVLQRESRRVEKSASLSIDNLCIRQCLVASNS